METKDKKTSKQGKKTLALKNIPKCTKPNISVRKLNPRNELMEDHLGFTLRLQFPPQFLHQVLQLGHCKTIKLLRVKRKMLVNLKDFFKCTSARVVNKFGPNFCN